MKHPSVVAFDAVETLFSLEGLRPRLGAVGLPGSALDLWFSQLLRDAFALDATGVYRSFRDVAGAALERLATSADQTVDGTRLDEVLDAFSQLDAHPDVAPAMQCLRDHDVRVVTLTNGSAEVTHALLERAGLQDMVERVVSVDEVKRWKPAPEVYLHCARTVRADPSRLALVAAHDWDVHGAVQAGLATGFVARRGQPFSAVMSQPDVCAATLDQVAKRLIDEGVDHDGTYGESL